MSITYEEALSTLTSMFSDPWKQDDLDQVLRHFEGHMENTIDTILGHGNGTPQDLLKKLQSSKSGPDQVESDAQYAQQLALQQNQTASGSRGGGDQSRGGDQDAQTLVKKGRGIPTQLPADFLCVPGRSNMEDDAALARVLQDKLFAQELKNNPEFAHLARRNQLNPGANPRNRAYPGMNRGQQQQGPGVIEAISGMGENAKRRLQVLASRFKANRNRGQESNGNVVQSGESRGLLDGNEEQEVSFTQTDDDYEMRSMRYGDKKID